MSGRGGRFFPGDMVRSHFRARWIGEVLGDAKDHFGRPIEDCVLVRPLLTHDGRPQPRHIKPRTLHRSYLVHVERA